MSALTILLRVIELIAFVYLGFAAIYIFLFGFASLFTYRARAMATGKKRKFAVLIPGYKEDAVIVEVAQQALRQDYPKDRFDVIVIADSFLRETLEALHQLPVRVVEVHFEISTKSKALNAAMAEIGDQYDIALILDADNVMEHHFLEKINQAFDHGFMAVQGHRVAKNLNTNMAVLDAISEEVNNRIFRKGHRVLGLSSALIGSGMAFEYLFFKKLMQEIKAVGGFDKELELRLLKDRHVIEYVEEAIVLDEKVQKSEVFARQRKRWLSAQFIYFRRFVWSGLRELFRTGNLDFADKVYQMVQPPRILLLGLLTGIAFLMALIQLFAPVWMWNHLLLDFSVWLTVWLLAVLAFLFSVPARFYTLQTVRALVHLPASFFIMLMSLFRLKGANKRFIHTTHGVEDKKPENTKSL